jgi:plastocyanin
MPRLAPVGLTVTVLVVAAAPALAADHTITALSNNQFDRPAIMIATGDRVLFANSGGSHNFAFEDGESYPVNPTGPGPAWNGLSRTFTAAGTYRYYCELHGTLTTGMRGTITVTAAPPPPSPSPSPTPSPTPTPSPPPGPGGPSPEGTAPAQVRSLALASGRFCARRGPRCRRPGVRLRIDLSAPARVTGVLKRRAKRFGRVDFGTVAAGPRTLRLRRTTAGKRLRPGRYSLALRVDGAPVTPTLRFRVR